MYDLILLDLRLPDIEGVTVLQQLRHELVMTSVLVLTGFATVQAAVAAMRLGASDFREKPLIGDELVASVKAAMNRPAAAAPPPPIAPASGRPDPKGPSSDAESDALTELFAALDACLMQHGPDAGGPLLSFSTRQAMQQLTAHLLRVVVLPHLGVPTFVCCAQSLRLVTVYAGERPLSDVVTQARGLVTRAARYRGAPLDQRMAGAVRKLEATVGRTRLLEKELADEIGVAPSHLGRLLRAHTGLTYRQWRWGRVIQYAVQQLAQSDEQIAQIAYRVGYQHPGQFDRDFHHIFGMSPTALRRLLSTRSPAQDV